MLDIPLAVDFRKVRLVLQIPIARSPEATYFSTGLPTLRQVAPVRPKNAISELLFIPQNSITTQFAMKAAAIKSIRFSCPLLLKMVIHCQ